MNRAWNYNPGSGRFLSEDPLHFSGNDHNLYRYVKNKPVGYSDPQGLLASDVNEAVKIVSNVLGLPDLNVQYGASAYTPFGSTGTIVLPVKYQLKEYSDSESFNILQSVFHEGIHVLQNRVDRGVTNIEDVMVAYGVMEQEDSIHYMIYNLANSLTWQFWSQFNKNRIKDQVTCGP